jgi:transposase
MTLLAGLGSQLPERYYLGVDVGYREHVATVISLQTFVTGAERWKRARSLHFPSTRSGLEKLQTYLNGFCPDHQAFLGLCEPTGGFYGASLFQYLLDQGYRLWLVENATTRHMREQIFGNVPKTDELDSRVLARIGYLHEAVGEEFSLRPLQLPVADNADLLALCRDSWKLNTMITRARNQFAQLLAVIFPELKTFFSSSVSSAAVVTLISHYPTPAQMAAASLEELTAVLHQTRAHHHAQRAAELQTLARTSSGLLPDPSRAWRLRWLTDFLLSNFKAQAELEKQVAQLLSVRADYQLLVSIPYSGPTTLGIILAATGDIQRFPTYRKYVAYTGYFAGLEQSQTIDHTRMSRRGNRDLKRALFQIASPLVWFDPSDNPYKQLYQRKMAEGHNWYQVMPCVCAALARHIYHCLKRQVPYDVSKTLPGTASTPASEQALVDLTATLEEQFERMEAELAQTEP